jgi:hypothetical protein
MMRIRSLAVLAAASFAAFGPAAAQEPRGILFLLYSGQEGTGILVPVAVLGEHGYDALPARGGVDGTLGDFQARWFPAGRRYEVLRHGERAGTATVVQQIHEPCGNPDAEATLALTGGSRPVPWQALAGEGLPEQLDAPWVRASLATERRVLDGMAAALFAAHGIDGAGRTSTVTTATLLFGAIARPVLVGTYTLTAGHPLPRQASAFIIAEEGQDGYRPAFTDFHEGLAPDHRQLTLIDAADLDGDRFPDLVLENQFWQRAEYSILTRGDNGWWTAYRGGASGC